MALILVKHQNSLGWRDEIANLNDYIVLNKVNGNIGFSAIGNQGLCLCKDGNNIGWRCVLHQYPSTWGQGDITNHHRNCVRCNVLQTQAHTWVNFTGGTSATNHRCPTCLREAAHSWPAYGNWTQGDATNHTRSRTCSTTGCNQNQSETLAHVWQWDTTATQHRQLCGTAANNSAGTAGRCARATAWANHTWANLDATNHRCPTCLRLAAHTWGAWSNTSSWSNSGFYLVGTCRRVCSTSGCARPDTPGHTESGWENSGNDRRIRCTRCNLIIRGRSIIARHCYKTILGRDCAVQEQDYWTGYIAGANARDLYNAFFLSAEFVNANYNNTEFARRCYRAYGNYEPSASEVNTYVNILNSGTSRDRVRSDYFAPWGTFINFCTHHGVPH